MQYAASSYARQWNSPYNVKRETTSVTRWSLNLDTTGTITNFSNTVGGSIYAGGDRYYVQTAGKSYSLTNPDPQTLQFEIRPGDHASFDGSSVDRSQVDGAAQSWAAGTPTTIDYQLMVQPNGPNNTFVNTASWTLVGEIHNVDTALGPNVHTSPPVYIGLDGDHLFVGINNANTPGGLKLWTDPNPIVPGQYNDIRIQSSVVNNSSGYLDVWINGQQVVNYHGSIGFGTPTYWDYGLYRQADAPQTITVDCRNLTLVTGSQAAGWTGVGGTSSGPTGTPTTPVSVAPTVTQASASPGTGVEHAGDTITITLGFSKAVTVTGTPTLSLNDGGTATYVGGSGTSSLTFKTTVASTGKDTSALAITSVNLPTGASIKDGSGLAANLSGVVKTFSGLQINPILPAVTQATASPGTGTEHVGDTITLALGFNEAVTVTGTPTLSLNDGAKATYVSGSGTGTLTFKTTVASTNTSTSALAITGVNLPSGTAIKDASGIAANLSAAVKTFSGLAVSTAPATPTQPTTPTTPPTPSATKPVTTPTAPTTPTTPTTPSVQPAVTQATASPGTGTEHVGDAITLSLGFNEAVTVTGTPTLSLNDGAKATYVSGSGTGTLTFKTTVASTNTSTSALAITGVNLPSGTAIKDASGIAANLSAAVKTFSGLAVSTAPATPTQPTTPTTPPTPSATKPVLTVADHSLWVAGRGGKVDLGTKVTTTDSNDHVTVNITGLPRYETITDKLDGQTFRGDNITLTAAQVASGLELHSYYRGGGHPTATLTLTASAKDPTTGAVATASPQTITVVDPRPATTTTTTTSSHHHHHHHHHHTATNQHPVATTTAAAPTTSHTTESTGHQHTAAANTGSLASQGFALLQQHFDPAASTLATTAAHPIMAADHPAATGTTMASFASQGFALLNQYLAAHTGHVDPGQFVAALSQATGWGHDSLLARPQH
ncbi:heparin lyase I family protein [Bradyrhizobium sp. BWC-3-1]|uniref:heparin lyase I family protein n=1 Tax=Bradyrhizobium sp. BWC-3-1 TaxID=3080012 RepID=UPI00293F5F7F|nr:heparin lyase I family protein [Bradyrhizobium sp. BWC-3-1]WOH56091.1 heparin lyase I family protein [Bradyrhizobium sp. BWC-3-1]